MTEKRDIFVCHASEDKQKVVVPLIEAIEQEQITYWYDEAEILWGDSITEKVNKGLRISEYVLVIFSEAFCSNNWTQRELNASLNQEASSGKVRVLPLVVGTREQRKRIYEKYPVLNDKKYVSWETGTKSIVDALKRRLLPDAPYMPPSSIESEQAQPIEVTIPNIPQISKSFTQRDKDRYLREAYKVIKEYFEAGAKEINRKYPEVELEVESITQYKFVCSIYRHGNLVNRCKIWIGGLWSSDNIAYYAGTTIDINDDGSLNDWLSVDDSKSELGLKKSNMGLGLGNYEKFEGTLSAQQAAEYLWLRSIETLSYE